MGWLGNTLGLGSVALQVFGPGASPWISGDSVPSSRASIASKDDCRLETTSSVNLFFHRFSINSWSSAYLFRSAIPLSVSRKSLPRPEIVGSSTTWPDFTKNTQAILRASLEIPASEGTFFNGTPCAVRSRRTFALWARDTSTLCSSNAIV